LMVRMTAVEASPSLPTADFLLSTI
jgi:hypothetical protein